MGPCHPTAVYCAETTFAAGGYEACLDETAG